MWGGMWLFSDLQDGFRSSWSTADLLTAVCDRIARAFNRSGATWYIQGFQQGLTCFINFISFILHKFKSDGISGQIFGLILSFNSNRQLCMVLDGKSSQEYLVNAGVYQGSILDNFLVLNLTYYILMTYLMILSVILLSMLVILLSTLSVIRYLICGNN